MLNSNKVKAYFDSPLVKNDYSYSDHTEAMAALPDASINFLIESCKNLGVQRIFEFGSGRSTKALLQHGFKVTSLEDSVYWMNQTLNTLDEKEKVNHTAIVQPLKVRFLGLFPVLDWSISQGIAKYIGESDLILVDSPYYTPFRESTLWSALKHINRAIIILDDTRIPTLQRFCTRLSFSNTSVVHARVSVGHSFDIFYHESTNNLVLNHSWMDTLKGWGRFIQGQRFYNKLDKA